VTEADPNSNAHCRYFVSYSGVKLPLNLVTPLDAAALNNRNTYFRAWFDGTERLIGCDKITYGEIELMHRYEYYPSGSLKRAEIINTDEEVTEMSFDEQGGLANS
jgi:Family of unknown function (DUF6156)